MNDLLIVAGLSVLACAVVGLAGAAFLRGTRGASLRLLVAVAAVLPVLAVAASVVVNVRLMFLSPHDTTVVLIALAVALLLALAGCWLMTRSIGAASQQLQRGVGLLVADSRPADGQPTESSEPPGTALPAELARVFDQLAEARRTLAAARARERAAEQSRRELVSFMSHDLRTPLAGLRALAEGLEDGVITDVQPALAQLRATVARMTTMVDDLFALSRVYDGPPEQPLSMVSLTELVLDVVAEAEPTAEAAGVRLSAIVPDGDPLAVLGRYDDLNRALANLVSNAIRHTGARPEVEVEAERAEDGSVRVAVLDGCGGIPDEHLNRVFDTGWRGSPDRGASDAANAGGAGLGLAIARGVVESHRGEIAVRNTDVGCCFEMALPQPVADRR